MVAWAGEEGVLGMNEFLLKEICCLLYHLANLKNDRELTRQEYLKDLDNRYKQSVTQVTPVHKKK